MSIQVCRSGTAKVTEKTRIPASHFSRGFSDYLRTVSPTLGTVCDAPSTALTFAVISFHSAANEDGCGMVKIALNARAARCAYRRASPTGLSSGRWSSTREFSLSHIRHSCIHLLCAIQEKTSGKFCSPVFRYVGRCHLRALAELPVSVLVHRSYLPP
jgi:hypothetical protein